MSSARLLRGVARFERARSHFATPSPCRCRPSTGRAFECVPACGERVERRPDVIRGRISFVSIHTRPTEARDPSPEVYRAVREARNILMVVTTISKGKGLRDGQETCCAAMRCAANLQGGATCCACGFGFRVRGFHFTRRPARLYMCNNVHRTRTVYRSNRS